MNILVIGGTGFLSNRTVIKLLALGHQVTIFTRGKSRKFLPESPHLDFVVGDRRNEDDLRRSLGSNKSFDVVYDFVAYHPEESEMAINVFEGRVGRFIHCSTISVYMVSDDVRCPITEDQDRLPLMSYWDRNPFGMDYGIQKRACEDVLWSAHRDQRFPVSMLRPTFICGPDDPAKRDFFWIERILDGKPLLIPGSGDFAFQSVYLDDVAQAFVDLLDYNASIGQAYNVVGEEIFSLNDYLRSLCRLLKHTPEFIHVDQEIFDELPFSRCPDGDVFPFNTRRTTIFSLDKIKRDLKYRSTPFDKWMGATIDWYLKKYPGHSFGYERRSDELHFIQQWEIMHRKSCEDGVRYL